MKINEITRSTIIILIMVAFITSKGFAQDTSLINHTYSDKSQYLFDKFTKGTAFFEKGGLSTAKFNYNVVAEEMQFIDDETIKSLVTDDIEKIEINNIFFEKINEKFYQVLHSTDDLELFKFRKPDLSSLKESEGAYGTSASTASVQKVTNVSLKNVLVEGSVNLKEENSSKEIDIHNQYIIKDGSKEIQVTRRRILRRFRKYKDKLKSFIKEEDINFRNDDEMIKLVNYIQQLKESKDK